MNAPGCLKVRAAGGARPEGSPRCVWAPLPAKPRVGNASRAAFADAPAKKHDTIRVYSL